MATSALQLQLARSSIQLLRTAATSAPRSFRYLLSNGSAGGAECQPVELGHSGPITLGRRSNLDAHHRRAGHGSFQDIVFSGSRATATSTQGELQNRGIFPAADSLVVTPPHADLVETE
jgi:hypothetical protein